MATQRELLERAEQWYPGKDKNIWSGSQDKRFQSLTDPRRLDAERALRDISEMQKNEMKGASEFGRESQLAELRGQQAAREGLLGHQRALELEGVKQKGQLGLKTLELSGKRPTGMLSEKETLAYKKDRDKYIQDELKRLREEGGGDILRPGMDKPLDEKGIKELTNNLMADYDSRILGGVSLFDAQGNNSPGSGMAPQANAPQANSSAWRYAAPQSTPKRGMKNFSSFTPDSGYNVSTGEAYGTMKTAQDAYNQRQNKPSAGIQTAGTTVTPGDTSWYGRTSQGAPTAGGRIPAPQIPQQSISPYEASSYSRSGNLGLAGGGVAPEQIYSGIRTVKSGIGAAARAALSTARNMGQAYQGMSQGIGNAYSGNPPVRTPPVTGGQQPISDRQWDAGAALPPKINKVSGQVEKLDVRDPKKKQNNYNINSFLKWQANRITGK